MSAARSIVVVPCYNEAERLNEEAFLAFADRFPDHRLLFVDDGSTDKTLASLEALHAVDEKHFGVLALKENVGKAEAVRRGVLHALERDPAYVGFLDADLATPLSVIPAFCDLLDQRPTLELVTGARVQMMGRKINRHPLRHYAGRTFAFVTSLILRLRMYDTQCGAKMFRVTPHLPSLFRTSFQSDWIFDVEILARMIDVRQQKDLAAIEDVLYELPLQQWIDPGGSKLSAGSFMKATYNLIFLYVCYQLWRRTFSERSSSPVQDQRETGSAPTPPSRSHDAFRKSTEERIYQTGLLPSAR